MWEPPHPVILLPVRAWTLAESVVPSMVSTLDRPNVPRKSQQNQTKSKKVLEAMPDPLGCNRKRSGCLLDHVFTASP